MENRIPFVDMLRAFSVLYIVGFWHLLNYTRVLGYISPETIRLTVAVLGLFVFISGNLLGRSKLAAQAGAIMAFYRSRLLRVFPLYCAALMLFVYVGLINTTAALKAVTSVSMFAGPAPPTLWFVAMLLVFYLVAPLLIATADNWRRFMLATAGVMTALGLAYGLLPKSDARLLIYFPAFALGIWAARCEHQRGLGLFYALATASIAVSYANGRLEAEASLYSMGLAAFVPLTVFVTAERYLARMPPWLPLTIVSYAGFVMYLDHRPIFMTMKKTYFPANELGQLAYLVFICLPVIIGVSLAIQWIYDIFFRNVFGSPSRTQGAGADPTQVQQ